MQANHCNVARTPAVTLTCDARHNRAAALDRPPQSWSVSALAAIAASRVGSYPPLMEHVD